MTSPPPNELAVQTIGLGKRFGARAALDGVDLAVPRGVAFGFLGANGAGKTRLIRLLLGLAEPTAGTMRVLAIDDQCSVAYHAPTDSVRTTSASSALPATPSFWYVWVRWTATVFMEMNSDCAIWRFDSP